jgi:hypothetical protein
MRPLWVGLLAGGIVVAIVLLGLIYLPEMLAGSGLAQQQPARSEALAVGPYRVQVQLSENPPVVGHALDVRVAPGGAAGLTGQLIAYPLTGTDSTPINARLLPDPADPGRLMGSLQLPVRGAWRLMVELDGPLGRGSAGFAVTSEVPFVIPAWLGWLLGLSPLIGCAWLIWHQWSYRRHLLTSARSSRGKAGPTA